MTTTAGVSELLLRCHRSHDRADKEHSPFDVDINSLGKDIKLQVLRGSTRDVTELNIIDQRFVQSGKRFLASKTGEKK